MTVEELLVDLARRGIQVWTEGDNLNVRVPKGTLSLALRTALTECKPEIMWHLSHGHANGTGVREYPLSYGQRTFWFYYQMAPSSAAYNVMHAAWIRSDLDIARLRRAFQLLVDLHSPLRTTYTTAAVSPSSGSSPIRPSRSRSPMPPHGTGTPSTDRLQEIADRPFDLEQGPVLRVRIFTRCAARACAVAHRAPHRGRFLVA